ncbi:MAG: hypothetical protein AAFS10_06510 [Myxococcota bacterium]
MFPHPSSSNPPTPKTDPLWRFQRQMAAYLVGGATLLMVVGVAACVALVVWWNAHLEPISDGERVLELQRSPQAPKGDAD